MNPVNITIYPNFNLDNSNFELIFRWASRSLSVSGVYKGKCEVWLQWSIRSDAYFIVLS